MSDRPLMRIHTPFALLGAAALVVGSLLIASPANAAAPNNPPIITPQIQQLIPTSSFTAEWDSVISTNGATQYEYQMSANGALEPDGSLTDLVATGVTTATSVVIPAQPDNFYYFQVRAGDGDGWLTWTNSGYRVFLIDTTGPAFTVTSAVPVTGPTYALTFDVDEFTPFDWNVQVDGTSVASGSKTAFETPTSLSASIDLSGLAVGTHTIRISGIDALGNEGETSITYVVAAALAVTGADVKTPLLFGGLIVVTGLFLLAVRRFSRAA